VASTSCPSSTVPIAWPGFARVAAATIDFSTLTGGTWAYNDGAEDRKSGHSFDASVAWITYGPEEWAACSAHKRLGLRGHLLEMARTDPRLKDLRDGLVAALHTPHKDTTT